MAFSMKLPAGKGKKKPLSAPLTSGSKQYGLILPKKDSKKKELSSVRNVFAVAANECGKELEKNDEKDAIRRVGAEAARSLQQSQVDKVRAQALAEDASVFDYDAVYDDMKAARESEASNRAVKRELDKKKPKYISTLLQQAKIREVENERIRERRLLNERKADDAQYGDKEKLVSASYKRKLQEMQNWDVEDARLAALEDQEDVTKQGEHAMAGFYANLNKNIAMGGTIANARSAYTAKETQVAENVSEEPAGAEWDHDRGDLRKHESAKTRNEPATTKARSGEQLDDSLACAHLPKPRDDEAKDKASLLQTVEAEKPTLSKEDAIAAARARFLARKAQRKLPPA